MQTKLMNRKNGLSENEVENSRRIYGSNALTQKNKEGFFKKYLESFGDPMIKVLLVALCINVIVMIRSFDWYEPLGIAVSIMIATLISTISEYGSESAFEKLQADSARLMCKVRRAGKMREISIDDIVVNDRILLQTGDRVPADGIVVEGKISVDQSTLNGEAKEKEKTPKEDTEPTGDFLSRNEIFRGTVVCQGECEMSVTAVGDKTFYGKMAREVQQDTRKSPLNLRLTELAGTISKIGYTGSVLVGIAYIFQILCVDFHFNIGAMAAHYSNLTILFTDILNLITLVVTVIVVAVPEGLPMMITVVLSANIRKMLKDNVLVRKMTGIETAGSMNILFTDKTGTLTCGKLAVNSFLTGDGKQYDAPAALKKQENIYKLLCGCAFFNTGAVLTTGNKSTGGNATDRALLDFVSHEKKQCGQMHREVFIPFSSEKKFSAAQVDGEMKTTFIKGSPDLILPLCKNFYDANGRKIDSSMNELRTKMRKLSRKAVRLIAIATSDEKISNESLPTKMTLVCIVGLRDDLRSESKESVSQLQMAGIQVVMMTGDSKETAAAIASECGIVKADSDLVLTSAELAGMSDNEICSSLSAIKVIARALPGDKSRLVRIAQGTGKVVGMTGDGVNDAPALKAADVGFSMGSGTEVAKEASDVVILDDNIKSIGNAVLYGRTIFKSIRKFIIYQLTINFGAVGLSIIGPILGIDTPVTVMQMLWINLVMDTLAGIAYSGECAKKSYMGEKPKRWNEKILNRYMISSILWMGSFSLFLSLIFFKSDFLKNIIGGDGTENYLYTAFFALFMFMAIFNSFNARTHEVNLLSYLSRNKPFIIIIAMVFLAQTLMLYIGGSMFRTAGLSFTQFLGVIVLAATVIPADLIRKKILKKLGRNNGV